MPDIYQNQIISRSQRPEFGGTLEQPTHIAEGANLSCGDEVRWELQILDGRIADIKHQCRACAICTSSADLLAERLHHQPKEVLDQLRAGDVQAMMGIPLSPIRLKCALLPLETLRSLKEA